MDNSTSATATRTVFSDIFDWMMVPILILAPIGAGLIFLLSVSLADSALDQPLSDRLRKLAGELQLKNGQITVDEKILGWVARSGRVYYSVRTLSGETLMGDDELPAIAPEPLGEIGLLTVTYNEQRLRSAALRTRLPDLPDTYVVVLAEPAETRQALAREIMREMIVATFIIVTSLVLLMTYGLRVGLRPLEKLRATLQARRPDDLSELDVREAPAEVQPLLQSFNHLIARVQAASEAQQRFIANAAHQLRTPLAAIRTQTQLALRSAQGTSRDALQNIETGTLRSTRVVNQLLALSRADSAEAAALAHEDVELSVLAREVVESEVPHALQSSIDLGLELPPNPVRVRGNETLLREMLANLVDNAIKYGHPGGTVTVRVGEDASLEVEDDGIGIPEAEREQVFERFHRVMGTHATGSGLGLSIVREVAERHGGKVVLATPPGGRGCLFRISLPRLADHP